MDFEEMKGAVRRATEGDLVTRLEGLLLEGAEIVRQQADEIERLRLELREARSEIQRLTTQANYAS